MFFVFRVCGPTRRENWKKNQSGHVIHRTTDGQTRAFSVENQISLASVGSLTSVPARLGRSDDEHLLLPCDLTTTTIALWSLALELLYRATIHSIYPPNDPSQRYPLQFIVVVSQRRRRIWKLRSVLIFHDCGKHDDEFDETTIAVVVSHDQ